MASYASILLFFFFLALSLSFKTHARDSNFFSKVAKTTKQTTLDSTKSESPAISPSLAPSPSPESEVVERGYGLYGSEPYEFTPTTTDTLNTPILGEEKYVPADELSGNEFYGNGNGNEYQYPPTTGNPTKTPVVGEEKYVAAQDLSDGNGNGNGIGAVDLRLLENEKYSFKGNEGNEYGNGYGAEKQGMSDTRFLENGKYFYDVQNEEGLKGEKSTHFNTKNYENEDFEKEKHGMNWGNEMNGNGNEKQGMSDTRYLENGKYYYDIKREEGAKQPQTAHFNANKFEDENFEEEKHGMDRYAHGKGYGYVTEKQGMSDTRFLENGKYFYDLNSEKGYSNEVRNGKYFNDMKNENGNNGYGNEGFLNNNNGYGNGNEEEVYEGNDGNLREERNGNYGSTKKLPNTYDSMEEYDREQGYIDPKDVYIP